MGALSDELDYQYHACVPLGWGPVSVAGTYYPGYIASVQNYGEFLDAIWRARIGFPEIGKRRVKPVYEVLNHLVSAGLLVRKRDSSAYNYYLTMNALPYFYGSSRYGNNNGSMKYLCYSKVVPDRLLWVQRIPSPSDWIGPAQWYHVAFSWKPSSPAPWARDPFLREHSVILSPLRSPTQVKIYFINGRWHIADLYDYTWMLPVLHDASAWKPKATQQ